MRYAFVFANGDLVKGIAVDLYLQKVATAFIVAVDGGLRHVDHLGFPVDLIIGDLDSVGSSLLHKYTEQGIQVIHHPREKDETDLELALNHVGTLDVDRIIVFGVTGGRIDHMFANFYLLALPSLDGKDAQIVADNQIVRMLKPGHHVVEGNAGDLVSLIPISESVTGVVTDGLEYPLRNETLTLGPARGISNVMADAKASVSFTDGKLLLIHTIQQRSEDK